MKTPQSVMGPVNTRGDFRRLSEPAERVTYREDDPYPNLDRGHPIWEAWQCLIEIYSSFISLYGEQPTWGWVGVLNDLSAADIGVGIAAVRDRPKTEFPPNAQEFYQLCRSESPAQKRNRLGTERHPDAKALPNPNAILDSQQAKPYLAKMREMLTGGTTL